MRYTVEEKVSAEKGPKASFVIGMWAPNNSKWITLPVEEDDFNRIRVGDVIEMLISVVPKEVSNAE